MNTVYVYVVVIALVCALLLVGLLRCLITVKRCRNMGYVILFLIYAGHDIFLSLSSFISNLLNFKYIEYILFYILMFIIFWFFFQGAPIYNLIKFLVTDFVLQGISSILAVAILVPISRFNVSAIEQITDTPSPYTYMLFFFSGFLSFFISRMIIKILFGRKNRILNVFTTIIACIDMLPGLINSGSSFYVIFPPIILILFGSIIYQELSLQQKEKQETCYHELEERLLIRQEELSKIRHDVANHVNVIEESGSAEYARQLLQQIDQKMKSGIPILDVLLEEKERACIQKGITFQWEPIDLSQCILTDMEWVSLFGNIMDNALEACEQTDGEKVITLQTKRQSSYLLLEAVNSKCKDRKPEQNNFFTSKKQAQGHGYGVRIIKEIVKKYEGRIRYEDTGARMILHITMRVWK